VRLPSRKKLKKHLPAADGFIQDHHSTREAILKRVHTGAGSARRARRLRCLERFRLGDDAGFGLIEVLVALTVLTVVLLTVERGTIATLSAESLAKEHSVASTLVSAKIAEAESLSFPALKAGLNPSVDPLNQDPNISSVTTPSGTSYVFIPTGATLATSGTATSEPPIIPHISTVNIGIPYEVAVYPTISSTDPGVVTITVIVTWRSPLGTTASTTGQAEVSSP